MHRALHPLGWCLTITCLMASAPVVYAETKPRAAMVAQAPDGRSRPPRSQTRQPDMLRTAPDAPRGFTNATQEWPMAVDFDRNASAGLFVGIQQFADRFSEVPFAVDDAVDLAYLFAMELQVLTPSRVMLSLAGSPKKASSVQRLQALLQAGAQQTSARATDILRYLEEQRQSAQEHGLLVVTFATHGFSEPGGDFLVAADSRRLHRRNTSIQVEAVFDEMSRARAPRRLLLLDACRERLLQGDRTTGLASSSAMSPALVKALANASGHVVLASTTLGGYAYDDDTRQNGVFTAAILEGLRGKAPRDANGFITIETLAPFVDEQVRVWVATHRPEHRRLSQGISRKSEPWTATLPLVSPPDTPTVPDKADLPALAEPPRPQETSPSLLRALLSGTLAPDAPTPSSLRRDTPAPPPREHDVVVPQPPAANPAPQPPGPGLTAGELLRDAP